MSLIYQQDNHATGVRTRLVRDADTGIPLIIAEQTAAAAAIVAENKRAAVRFDRWELRAQNLRAGVGVRVASIPLVIWRALKRAGIAGDEKRLRQWLSRRDARFLRTDDGRPL